MGTLDVCCINPSGTVINTELNTAKSRSSKVNKIATESEDQNRNILSSREKEPQIFNHLPSTSHHTPSNGINYQQILNRQQIDGIEEDFGHSLRIKQIKEVYSKAPWLHLEVMNSGKMPIGLQFKISPYGLDNSYRKIRDGYANFGFQENIEEDPNVDYLITPLEPDYDARFIGIHFQIAFRPETLDYSLKDMGCGFGTFVKATDPVVIKDNCLINVGDTYIVFSFGQEGTIDPIEESNKDDFLNVKIFSGNESYVPYNFQKTKSIISIGRDNECDIAIEDRKLSRVQSVITYHENKGWLLADGKYDRKSLNGTWVYTNEEKTIQEGMVFKTNHNLFKCMLVHLNEGEPLIQENGRKTNFTTDHL